MIYGNMQLPKRIRYLKGKEVQDMLLREEKKKLKKKSMTIFQKVAKNILCE